MRALVIVADALHLGYLGCYGNEWIETPSLDRLAAEGVLFDWHFADDPTADGARRSWRTGQYVFPGSPPGAPAPDLVRLLNDRGVTTVLVSDGKRPGAADFDAGWHRVVPPAAAADADDTPFDRLLSAADEILEGLADQDGWLVWLELATLAPPWRPPGKFGAMYFDDESDAADEDDGEVPPDGDADETLEPLADPPPRVEPADDRTFARLQHTYAGVVSYLDAGVGLLLDSLRERGAPDDLLTVFTSDRGYPLGEHGVVGDRRPWLHDERIHIPLILRLPGCGQAGRRVQALTQAVDLMPTLLAAFGAEPPPVHGRSLWPLCHGQSADRREYVCAGIEISRAMEWAIRTENWSLRCQARRSQEPERGRQLYVKPDDRWEVNDVAARLPDVADALERTLCQFVEATGQAGLAVPALAEPATGR